MVKDPLASMRYIMKYEHDSRLTVQCLRQQKGARVAQTPRIFQQDRVKREERNRAESTFPNPSVRPNSNDVTIMEEI